MEYFVFLEANRALSHAMPLSYSPWLVAYSISIAIFSSYTAFLISDQLYRNNQVAKQIAWTITGCITLGGGIWAVHFIGMLALNLPVVVHYDLSTTLLSVIPVFIASLFFFTYPYERFKKFTGLFVVSLVIGVGIATMHYTGMSAMRMSAIMRYDPGLFVLSIFSVIILAYTLLVVKYRVESQDIYKHQIFSAQRIFSAIIIGGAISAMHYIAMSGVYFFPLDVVDVQQSVIQPELLAKIIHAIILMVFLLLIAISYIGKQFGLLNNINVAESRLRAIIDNVGEGIISINEKGIIKEFNLAAENIFGYSANEVLEKNVNILMPEPDHARHDEYIGNFLKTGESKILGISRRVAGQRKNGEKVMIELTVTSIEFADQQVFTGLVRDITKRIEVEQEVEQYRKHLEDLVAERTAALESSNKELETFSYTVSHDLRAPLRSINGFSHILIDEYHDILGEEGNEYLSRISTNVKRMDDLINDLLKLSQVSKMSLKYSEVDVTELAEEKVKGLREMNPDRCVRVDIAAGLKATADKNLVGVVLDNLLDNSWKYTGKKDKAEIELGEALVRGERVFYVKDNGAGFDMSGSDKLFTAFQRMHDGHDFEGTGVGLATVQRVILRHGGQIWAEAEQNIGATFYFTFQPKKSYSENIKIDS